MTSIDLGNEEKWDGMLSISYDRIEKDLFYYNVDLNYKKKRVKIRLPRYTSMIGWIEVFGLPPQNEWVVLEPVKSIHKKGILEIMRSRKKIQIKEEIFIQTSLDTSTRFITLVRSFKGSAEKQTYIEDWSDLQSKRVIRKYIHFEHSGGIYSTKLTCYKNPSTSLLTPKERDYLQHIQKAKGKSKEIWLKKFSALGNPPRLYNMIFPFWKDTWKNVNGRALEIGYEREMSHGDWYKLFTLGKRAFEIKEDGWKSKRIKFQGKKIRIKDTYRKSIRELF